jgi:methyltransferase FkbM-like protein
VPRVTAGRRLKVAIKNLLGLRGVKQVRLIRGPARGVRMTLDFAGHTPMYLGMYEWELHRFLRERLPGSLLVFDVGGYIGYDALVLAKNSIAQVVTFEPNPANQRLLQANIDQNPDLRDRIVINSAAIGRHDGDGATTLDLIAEKIGMPDFIKMDIDGGEFDALAGGVTVLRERLPSLIVETHSKRLEDECGALLVEYGYRPIVKHNRQIWREQRGGAEHNRWLLAPGRPRTG